MSISVRVVKSHDVMRDIYGPAARGFFQDVLDHALGEVVEPGRVPIDDNFLRPSLYPAGGVSGIEGNPPHSVRIGTKIKAKGKGKANYGAILEKSTRTHYLRGPSKGKPTKGWLSDTTRNEAAWIQRRLGVMGKDMEKLWRR